VWPVVGPITQPFGVPELGVGSPHTGVDIGQDSGSPVRAAQSGRVVFSGGDPCCGLGYWIEVNHGDGYSTRYGHLLRPPLFLRGDYVNKGQIIGFSGDTGFSTGPHVHFEVAFNGYLIDPLRVLPSR
jgi:murein DD-endopeptidase MepM/ murein hydrolase activator NlpD